MLLIATFQVAVKTTYVMHTKEVIAREVTTVGIHMTRRKTFQLLCTANTYKTIMMEEDPLVESKVNATERL